MKKIIGLGLLGIALFSLTACEPEEERIFPNYDNALFSEVFDHLLENHYSRPDADALWAGAIQGLIDALDDPYTRYLSAEEFQRFQDSLGESFVGIGVQVENIDNLPVIRQVFRGSPAERAGLQAGDTITHVDGVDYRQRGYFDILAAILGELGTPVEVGVFRVGERTTLFLEMTRAVIENPTVVTEVFREDEATYGYIRVNSFGSLTFSVFNSNLSQLEQDDSIEGLIIDLRNNSGGLLTTVQRMMDLFLARGDLPMFIIEQVSNGEVTSVDYNATGTQSKDYPIVILINGNSASASEVFAAGMVEKGGYVTLGTPSFGKGTMQIPKSLTYAEGDELQTSVGRWLTPNGTWVNNQGGDVLAIEPTHVVEQNPNFLAVSVRLDPDQVLAFDTVSNQNENVQVILNALGYTVRSDGYFDLAMQAAVERFQADHQLTVSGSIDVPTAAKLSELLFNYRQDLTNDAQIQAALELLRHGND